MDLSNLSDARRLARSKEGSRAKLMLWGEYAGHGGEAEVVEDPYYGGGRGFRTAFEQLSRFTKNFLDDVVPEAGEKA